MIQTIGAITATVRANGHKVINWHGLGIGGIRVCGILGIRKYAKDSGASSEFAEL